MKRVLAVVVILAGLTAAGCLESGDWQQRQRNTLEGYRLVLHPPSFSWNASATTLSGNVTLASLYDGATAPETRVILWSLDVKVEFNSGGKTFQGWTLGFAMAQNPVVEPGETFVANWTVGRSVDANRSVDGIDLTVSYGYRAFPNRTDKRYDTSVDYGNACIRIENGSAQTQAVFEENHRCNPWDDERRYWFSVEEATTFPPMAHWEGWRGWENFPRFAEPMQPVRAYMQNPSFKNVTYFEGEIW